MNNPEKIGRYEVERQLGHGGMAIVFLAHDPLIHRPVAIKVLPRQLTFSSNLRERFNQEAKIIASLQHPAIVPIYDFGEHDEQPYLVMPYMGGGSLRDRVSRPMSLAETANILNRLAPALDKAHAQGIIHRDLKPDNVLFDTEGLSYLADFGIARLAEATQTMTRIGTPAYMSPEQVQGNQTLDARTDIYALGVLLFEMLTSGPPFQADTPPRLMFMHVYEPVPDIRAKMPELPAGLQPVIEKALAKDPVERYASAGALSIAVQEVMAGQARKKAVPPPPVTVKEIDSTPQNEPAGDEAQTILEPAAEVQTRSWPRPAIFIGCALLLLCALILPLGIWGGARLAAGGFGSVTEEIPTPTVALLLATEESPISDPEVALLECRDDVGCVEIGPDEPIKIASALIISGPDAQLGLDSQNGVEIAIDFKGDVLGHPIELQPEDDQCSAEGGQIVAQKIVSDPQILGLIGTSCSGAAVPASAILAEAGYVMISPSNTAPALTDPDTHQPTYLRTSHNDQVQGRAMAEFVFNDLGVTRAAAIHDGDPYTEGLASVFRDEFSALGGEIVAFEAVDRNADDVTPLLTSIAAAGPPELIYYPVFTNLGANITRQARDVPGLEGVLLAAADGVQSPDFLGVAGDAAEGMYVSGPDLNFDNDTYDRLLAAYAEKFGTEPLSVFHAHAFDATMLLLNAIEAVAQVGNDGTLLIGRQELRDELFATSGYAGVTGTLTCTEFGDCADPQITVSQVQGGEFVAIWP